MERYLFFNSTTGDVRQYQASDFAWYFSNILKSGLIHTDGVPELEVLCDGTDLRTYVVPGKAVIHGHAYENTSDLYLEHALPEASMDRIDRIVLRLDKRNQSRYIRLFVLQGEPSASPVAPSLQKDEFIHELSLAQIRVRANTSALNPDDLEDERLNESLCGLVEIQNSGFVPINMIKGIITMWSGAYLNIPTGWYLCDGQNGTPDLRDRFILGATTEAEIGDTGGSNEVTLTEDQMPSHTHTGSTSTDGNHTHTYTRYDTIDGITGYDPASNWENTRTSNTGTAGAHSHTFNINSTGGDQPFDNRPAFYKLAFIMKA